MIMTKPKSEISIPKILEEVGVKIRREKNARQGERFCMLGLNFMKYAESHTFPHAPVEVHRMVVFSMLASTVTQKGNVLYANIPKEVLDAIDAEIEAEGVDEKPKGSSDCKYCDSPTCGLAGSCGGDKPTDEEE